MEYHVELNGKTYNLPARTLEMDDRITMIRDLDRRVKSGEITRREDMYCMCVCTHTHTNE